MYFKTKNPEIYKIFENLIDYPITKVDPRIAQDLSRYKKIRYLSRKDKIWIKKGIIGVPKQMKIKKKNNGFELFFD